MNVEKMAELVAMSIAESPTADIAKLCGKYYQPYYLFMYLAAISQDQGCCVELGVEKGRGSGSMALSGKPVYGIDHSMRVKENVQPLVDRFSNYTFINAPSLPVPVELVDETISLLHIDTEHTYSQAEAEFEAYEPYLIDGAIVIFDDLHAEDDGVLSFFQSLHYPKIQDDRLHPVTGWGALLYEH